MENKRTFTIKWSTVTHHEAVVSARDWIDAGEKFWNGEVGPVVKSDGGMHGEVDVREVKNAKAKA